MKRTLITLIVVLSGLTGVYSNGLSKQEVPPFMGSWEAIDLYESHKLSWEESDLKDSNDNINIYLPLIAYNSEKMDLCLTVPKLISPSNGSTLSTLVPLFQWDSGNDPNATMLRLQRATDVNFTQNVYNLWSNDPIGFDEFRFTNNFNPATIYYWRTWLLCGETAAPFSEVWSFTTGSGGTFLPAPTLIAPANGITLPSTSVTLQWSAVNGAVEYLVHWREVGQGGYTADWVTNTQMEIYWLDANTSYEWWISAKNDYAIGDDSEIWQFTTPVDAPSISPNDEISSIMVKDDGLITKFEE